MSATITPIIHSRPNKDGKFPLAIRITINRRSTLEFLGYSLNKNQWDTKKKQVKKHVPNYKRLNALISEKVAELQKLHLDQELSNTSVSSKQLREIYKGTSGKQGFFYVANNYLENLKKEGKYNQYNTNKPRLKRFQEHIKNDLISFEEISVEKLRDFKARLIGEFKISERTAINYLILIRTIYNRGIRNGYVESKYYPFGKGKIQLKFPDSIKRGLSQKEIDAIVQLDLSDKPKHDHARSIFLCCYALAGMRVSDLLRLRWSSIDTKEKKLYYSMGKNNKFGALKLNEKVLTLFKRYKKKEVIWFFLSYA